MQQAVLEVYGLGVVLVLMELQTQEMAEEVKEMLLLVVTVVREL
tara:strand:- start:49 stop:180 length:132 start_codon:yes stop_codon:yes gene_type:complete